MRLQRVGAHCAKYFIIIYPITCIDTYKGYTFGHTKTEKQPKMSTFSDIRNETARQIEVARNLAAGFTFIFSSGTADHGQTGTVVIRKVTKCYVYLTRTTTFALYGITTTTKTDRRLSLVNFIEEYIYAVESATPATPATPADVAVVAPLANLLEKMANAGTLTRAVKANRAYDQIKKQCGLTHKLNYDKKFISGRTMGGLKVPAVSYHFSEASAQQDVLELCSGGVFNDNVGNQYTRSAILIEKL